MEPSESSASPKHPLDEYIVKAHLPVALARSTRSLNDARRMNELGLHSAALVWAVRSAENFMRYFVLAPHFMETGSTWAEAMELGRRELGSGRWARAFRSVERWYGPFDRPLTESGSGAWDTWIDGVVQDRHDLVHGNEVPEPTAEQASAAIDFVARMMTWFPQRFLVGEKHPIGRAFRAALASIPNPASDSEAAGSDRLHDGGAGPHVDAIS